MPHPANIPLTPQTNEANFPRWQANALPGQSGYAYPRMLTRTCTPEDRAEWKERNRKYDSASNREYYESAPPRVGSVIPIVTNTRMVEEGRCESVGEPVIVRDAEDERVIKEMLGLHTEKLPAPKIASIPIAGWNTRPEVSEVKAKPKRGRPRKAITAPPTSDVWVDEASKE